MTILAGIDEAGFGPLLGPLVVSSCVFSVAETSVEADLWEYDALYEWFDLMAELGIADHPALRVS